MDEEASAYVISGGTPANVGSNPSQGRGEILKFEDNRPADRRADYIDFRGDLLPNPPNSGGNIGDGDSDRFDHIFYVAPIDVNTVSPAGLAGLSRGFLRYTNRLAPRAISPGVTLGQALPGPVATVAVNAGGSGYTVGDTLTLTTGGTGGTVQVTAVSVSGAVTAINLLTAGSGYSAGVSATSGGTGSGATIRITVTAANKSIQGDNDHDGPILFDALDPGHQVAGGDDQVFPFRGDDSDGGGNNGNNTVGVPGPLNGGFEFLFSNPVGDVFSGGSACGIGGGVWNGFFLNSNGNITFGAGDDDNTATNTKFRSGLPKIAGAWTDLNPNSRVGFLGTFPVQAIGFANINAFKIRYINVPEFGGESCASANPLGAGQTNTFSFTLYDDGTGVDENANQPLNPANPIGNNAVPFDLMEGPTDRRWVPVTTGAGTIVVPENPRPDQHW